MRAAQSGPAKVSTNAPPAQKICIETLAGLFAAPLSTIAERFLHFERKIMSAKTKNLWTILSLITAASLCLIGVSTVRAQDEDAPRRLWDGAFLKKRAEAKTPAPARKTTAYRRATPKKPAAPNQASQSSSSN